VVRELVHPVHGLQTKLDRAPTIKQIKDALEEKMAPIYRERARPRYNPNQLPPPQITPEQRAEVAARVKAVADELKAKATLREAEERAKRPVPPHHNTLYFRACEAAGIDPNGGMVASPSLRALVEQQTGRAL